MRTDYLHTPCVKCGYCCSQGPCIYGRVKPDGTGCVHLTPDTFCAIYDQIVADPNSVSSPAFGAGCSSSLFNTVREAKIRKDKRPP